MVRSYLFSLSFKFARTFNHMYAGHAAAVAHMILRQQIAFSRGYRRKKPSHLFRENENEAAHRFLESLAEYRSTVRKPSEPGPISSTILSDVEIAAREITVTSLLASPDVGLVERFLQVSNLVLTTDDLTLEDVIVTPLIQAIANQRTLSEFSDDQLESVIVALRSWPKSESTRTPNFKHLWNSLDIQCDRRAPTWSTEKLLRVADYWYHLRLSRITRYNSAAIRLLSRNVGSLSPTALVHFLFLVNLQRDVVVPEMMDSVERVLLESFEVLSIEEIAVAAMGFFKSRTPVKSFKLLKAISAKLTSNLDKLTDATLLPVFKLLRFSMTRPCVDLYLDLQRKCLPLVDNNKLALNTVVHLALIGKRELVCHEQFLRQMVRRFMLDDDDVLKSVRLKEFARSVQCLALFSPQDADCLEYVRRVTDHMEKEEREPELAYYPEYFVSLLLFASYLNIYPLKLIRHCFSTAFLAAIQENASIEFNRELYALDCGFQIERPELASSIRLPLTWRVNLYKKFVESEVKISIHQEYLHNMSLHLRRILGGESFFHSINILPHFILKDMLVILDKAGNPKPIPVEVIKSPPGDAIKRSNDDKWLCIIIENSRTAPGKSLVKKRQLHALGYSVHEVPFFLYKDMTNEERKQFLDKLLFT